MDTESTMTFNHHDERLRKQALRVWLLGAALMALWSITILGAPVLASFGHTDLSQIIYRFFSFLCHQQSERSYSLFGAPLAVCARCFGVYFGLFLGFLVYPMIRRLDDVEPPSRIWLLLSVIPIGVDWCLGHFGVWENTHLSRFATGVLLGATCTIYLIPAFVEITRNRTLDKLS